MAHSIPNRQALVRQSGRGRSGFRHRNAALLPKSSAPHAMTRTYAGVSDTPPSAVGAPKRPSASARERARDNEKGGGRGPPASAAFPPGTAICILGERPGGRATRQTCRTQQRRGREGPPAPQGKTHSPCAVCAARCASPALEANLEGAMIARRKSPSEFLAPVAHK
jgi:hypothetical protein